MALYWYKSTLPNIGVGKWWTDVHYVRAGYYLAVGTGMIAKSYDGITWTAETATVTKANDWIRVIDAKTRDGSGVYSAYVISANKGFIKCTNGVWSNVSGSGLPSDASDRFVDICAEPWTDNPEHLFILSYNTSAGNLRAYESGDYSSSWSMITSFAGQSPPARTLVPGHKSATSLILVLNLNSTGTDYLIRGFEKDNWRVVPFGTTPSYDYIVGVEGSDGYFVICNTNGRIAAAPANSPQGQSQFWYNYSGSSPTATQVGKMCARSPAVSNSPPIVLAANPTHERMAGTSSTTFVWDISMEYSTDAANPHSFISQSVTYGNGRWVAIDEAGNVYYTASAPVTNYTLTLTADPTDGGTVTGAGTYAKNASVTIVATPADGYTFINWVLGNIQYSTEATHTFTITSTMTLTARFELIPVPTTQSVAYVYTGRKFLPAATYNLKFGDDMWIPLGSLTGAKAGLFDPDKCCTLGFFDGIRWITLSNRGVFQDIYSYVIEASVNAHYVCMGTGTSGVAARDSIKVTEYKNGTATIAETFNLYAADALLGGLNWSDLTFDQFKALSQTDYFTLYNLMISYLVGDATPPIPSPFAHITTGNLSTPDQSMAWRTNQPGCQPALPDTYPITLSTKISGIIYNRSTNMSAAVFRLRTNTSVDPQDKYFYKTGWSSVDHNDLRYEDYQTDLGSMLETNIPYNNISPTSVLVTSSGGTANLELNKIYYFLFYFDIEITVSQAPNQRNYIWPSADNVKSKLIARAYNINNQIVSGGITMGVAYSPHVDGIANTDPSLTYPPRALYCFSNSMIVNNAAVKKIEFSYEMETPVIVSIDYQGSGGLG